ncbi:hypothetical protein CBR_g21987 [Chara braunii]|uniref:Uncharacterized protein n=1 Tax=Chara braunii TaxID=69332 RepID=A0A388L1S3_CHABU|nr:hypothetical protein CBR_g21987 [Chara braunii]|eukprot:GBG76239.1 hypothetical protein CBR_g21987 [Chara braunii]
MLCFSDLAILAGAWDRSREEFDDGLRVLCERLKLRKQEYARECRELGGRSAKVERIFLRIWGVDDSHLEGRIPETLGQASPTIRDARVTKCDDLAIEAEEREEMERAIAAIANTIRDSHLTDGRTDDGTSERDRYTTFAPLASAYWVDTSTRFRHAIWKMETFNHVAPISIRALQFLGNITDAQWMEAYDPELCPCRLRRYADMRSPASLNLLQCQGHTHVITLDLSITDNPLLQGIINSGLNHIPCMALDVDVAENEVGDFLDRPMTRVLELRELTASSQSFLRRVILKRARAKMSKYREQHRHVSAEPFEHPAVKRELEFLTGRFLICPTDKAPNTHAFVCKNFIRKLAFQRLSGLGVREHHCPPCRSHRTDTRRAFRLSLASNSTSGAPVPDGGSQGAQGRIPVDHEQSQDDHLPDSGPVCKATAVSSSPGADILSGEKPRDAGAVWLEAKPVVVDSLGGGILCEPTRKDLLCLHSGHHQMLQDNPHGQLRGWPTSGGEILRAECDVGEEGEALVPRHSGQTRGGLQVLAFVGGWRSGRGNGHDVVQGRGRLLAYWIVHRQQRAAHGGLCAEAGQGNPHGPGLLPNLV